MKSRIIKAMILALAGMTLMTGCGVRINNTTASAPAVEAKEEAEVEKTDEVKKADDKSGDKKTDTKAADKNKKDEIWEFEDKGERFEFSADGFDGESYNQFSFTDYDLVIMNFWDPRNEMCVIEFPTFKLVADKWADKNVLVVGVVNGDPALYPNAQQRIEEYGLTYLNLYSNDSFGDITADGRAKTLFMTGDCMILPVTAEEVTDIMIYEEIGLDPAEEEGSNKEADKKYAEDIKHVADNYIGEKGEAYSPLTYVVLEELINHRLGCKIVR